MKCICRLKHSAHWVTDCYKYRNHHNSSSWHLELMGGVTTASGWKKNEEETMESAFGVWTLLALQVNAFLRAVISVSEPTQLVLWTLGSLKQPFWTYSGYDKQLVGPTELLLHYEIDLRAGEMYPPNSAYQKLFVPSSIWGFASRSSENCIHAVLKSRKVTDLWPEDEVAELRIGKENDEEHDGKSNDVLGTAR